MKKFVVAARNRDEIIRRRDEYQSDYEAKKKQHDEEYSNYQRAQHTVLAGVENIVRDMLKNVSAKLNLEIYAEEDWNYTSDTTGVKISVKSNEHDVHNKDKALSWNWSVKLNNDGDIVKDSGSWSGLNAVTEENLESLRLSVEALEILNHADWHTILKVELPKWEEYVKTKVPTNKAAEFRQELEEADLEEAIENRSFIKGLKNSGRMYRGDVYYLILSQSPKQYKVVECPTSYVDTMKAGEPIGLTEKGFITTNPESIVNQFTKLSEIANYCADRLYSYGLRKDNFMNAIAHPIEIISE